MIDKCYQIIELEYNEQITLSYISQKLNYSATYLGRLIKKHTNKSFSDILTDKRIAVAKEKLTTTNLLIFPGLQSSQDSSIAVILHRYLKRTPG